MNGLIASLIVGAGLGALLGRIGQCSSGACPLTANWKRGAIYGAVLGLMFHFASGGALGPYPEPKNMTRVAETNFHSEVTLAETPVVVDFYATWCGPCKILSPRLDRLAKEFGGKVKFVSVDVDRSPELSAKFGVQGVPTLVFVKDGKVVDTAVGVLSADDLRAKLEALARG